MKRNKRFSIPVTIGATALLVGAITAFSPLGGAMATDNVGGPPSMADGLLSEMKPGAVITKQADGSISITGTATSDVQAEIRRAKGLAQTFPTGVRCNGGTADLSCTAVDDSEIIPALRAGDTSLYRRVIYRGVTQDVTDRATGMFASNELVCGVPHGAGQMSCSRVDRVAPVIELGETLFVVYAPFNATFDKEGVPTFHAPSNAEIPLLRATG